ncbi:MAG TPA: hypothetical protein VM597_12220 [Gemmataceae bacterium]|nr:hypothetical protein [Gemmataceae bacterium]
MSPSSVLTWTGRVWGVASTLLLLAFMFGGAETMRPTAPEAVGLVFFPVGVIVGFGLAWWKEGLGGLVTVLCLALFYAWLYVHSGRFNVGPYFVLFAAPGFLHLAAVALRGSRSRPAAA